MLFRSVTTKVLCPPESLHSITYNNFQRNLFQDSQIELKKNIDNLLPKNLDDTIKTGFIEKIYENILNLLKPTGKVSELAAYYYDQNKVPYLKKIGDNPAMEKAITELIRQAFFILYVLDYNRYIQTTVYDSRIAQILKDGPNTKLSTDNVKELITLYTDKAQLALQSIDLIQNPFNQLYLGLQKGTEDTQSIVLACFLTAAKGYPVDSNKNIIEAFKSEIPEIKNSFTDNGTLKALEKVNALLSSKLASLTPAEIFKYNKQMIAFNQLSQIISSVKPGGAANTTPPEVTANINTLKNKFSAEKFNAALAYLSTEEKKIKNMDELINEKFCVVRDKIKYFDRVNNLFTQMNATTETIIVALQVGIAGDLSKLTEPKIMWKLYRAKKKSLKDGGKAFVAMIDNDIKNFITKEYGVSVDEYTAICDAWEAANPGSDPTEAFIKQWKKDREEENNRKNNIFGW